MLPALSLAGWRLTVNVVRVDVSNLLDALDET